MAQGESQGTGRESVREFRLADCDMRPATVDDIPAIVATLEAGRSLLAADGIDQWQNGTGPDVDLVTEDVEHGWGRVFLVDGQVAATAALIDEPDPNYALMANEGVHVADVEAFDIELFNDSMEKGNCVLTTGAWSGVHPGFVGVSLRWTPAPCYLAYPLQAKPQVRRFVDALARCVG